MPAPTPGASFRRDAPAVAVVALVVFGWWLARFAVGESGNESTSGDLRFYYFPLYALTSEWIAGGGMPLWNPWQALGTPWLATLQTGVFYPPHLLYLLFDTSSALAISNVLHLLSVAVGTAFFVRRLGSSRGAAILAALLYSLRGFLPWSMQYPSLLEAGSWLPWGCLAVLELARGRRLGGFALLAVCTGASLLAGYPQATVLSAYTWGTLLLVLVWAGRREGPAGLPLLVFTAAVALGAMIGAIQILPTFALTLEGARSTATLAESRVLSLGATGLWRLRENLGSGIEAVGALPLILAPAALFVRRGREIALWAAGLGLFAHALASGEYLGTVDLYRNIPIFGWFQHTTRLMLVSHFCLAVLAAMALDAITRGREASGEGSKSLSGPLAARAAAGISLLIAAALAWAAAGRGLAPGAATAAGIGVLLAASLLIDRKGWLAPACVLLAIAEISWGGTRLPRLPYSGEYENLLRNEKPFHDALAAEAGTGRVTWLGFGPPPWGSIKISGRSGVRWFEDYEPLALGRYATYRHFLRTGRLGDDESTELWRTWLSLGKPDPEGGGGFWKRSRLLDLAGVRLFVVPEAFTKWNRVREILAGMGLAETDLHHPTAVVFENPNAVPRAFVTYRTLVSPEPAELLERLSDADFDPLAASYVEGLAAIEPTPGTPRRGRAARILRDDPALIEIEATLDAPGLLVLADAVASGWEVDVDGEPAVIVPTNQLFRGVALPPGEHRVRFRYRPLPLVLGAGVSAMAVAALAGIVFWGRRRTPR